MSFDFLKGPSFYIMAICLFIFVLFLVKLVVVNRKILGIFLSYLVILIILYILKIFFIWANEPFTYCATIGLVIAVTISAPDIKNAIDMSLESEGSRKLIMGSEKTKKSIMDAVFTLQKQKIGALITIEKHLSLSQYSTKAIVLNADVSTELLIQIFITNTPLHDGAVIIRGDKIVCAGAYFILSENKEFESSTLGSRHRAALGISEKTDSLTVLVSEETGNIEVTLNGTMIKIFNKEMLDEFLSNFME